MGNRARIVFVVFLVPLSLGGGFWLRFNRPWESATERAYRICRECGLEDEEIAWLIETKTKSSLTRDEEIELYLQTFNGDDQAVSSEPCMPCVEAVLGVVGIAE